MVKSLLENRLLLHPGWAVVKEGKCGEGTLGMTILLRLSLFLLYCSRPERVLWNNIAFFLIFNPCEEIVEGFILFNIQRFLIMGRA